MSKAMIAEYLALAERHVAEGQQRVKRQRQRHNTWTFRAKGRIQYLLKL